MEIAAAECQRIKETDDYKWLKFICKEESIQSISKEETSITSRPPWGHQLP